MQDGEIVELYWQRDEKAISETQRKYGRYLTSIAYRVLANREDSRESVNETYLRAWRSMPPHRPGTLATYLGRITRQLSIDILRARGREKRRASEYALSIEELDECVCGGEAPEHELDMKRLAETVNAWLLTLPRQTRSAFVARYYYMEPVRRIAAACGASESKVKSMLYRARQGLRERLEQEGFEI